LPNPEIEGLLQGFEKEISRIKKTIAQLCWYMRGGVSYSELLELPLSDFKYFNEVVEDNMELSKKTKQLIL